MKPIRKRNSIGKPPHYIRKEIYSIEDVLKHVKLDSTKKDIIDFDGDPMKIGSDRYKTFKFKGLVCVKCGLEGKFFAKEKFIKQSLIESYHFNLYAINENGEEVLMTKDHIQPKSKGGKDFIENYQPMCTICNEEKGNII